MLNSFDRSHQRTITVLIAVQHAGTALVEGFKHTLGPTPVERRHGLLAHVDQWGAVGITASINDSTAGDQEKSCLPPSVVTGPMKGCPEAIVSLVDFGTLFQEQLQHWNRSRRGSNMEGPLVILVTVRCHCCSKDFCINSSK